MPTSNVPSRSFTCQLARKARFTVFLLILAVTFCTWASAFTQPPTRIARACRATYQSRVAKTWL
jgi:hypothetical protein